jgi:hypothetical protein
MKYLAVSLFLFGWIKIQAQEAILSSGGDASGSGGSVSYSVGQVVYNINTGTTGSVAQGVQQPYEISVANGVEETEGIALQFSAYPNPANDYLVLKVENYDAENLSYQLSDSDGKLLEISKLESNETFIITGNLVPAMYFLKVIDDNKEIKIFKIIKN